MTEEENLAKKVEENTEILYGLIEKCIPEGAKRDAILNMMEDMVTNFLVSPASSREAYHNSFYGGLFDHSVNVFTNLVKANDAFDLGFSKEEMFVVALLHDFGKCTTPDLIKPHYKDSEPWRKKKLGQGFEPDFSEGYFTNRDRTMFVLQHYQIPLSAQEYQAILLNDGLNVDANRAYSMKEYDLSFWTQMADCWAARTEKIS